MKQEQIEKAARDYIKPTAGIIPVAESISARLGFIAGAQWCINTVWHDAKEKPERENEYLLIEYRDWGSDESDYDVVAVEKFEIYADRPYSDLIRWAYISDLSPERKEEI